MATVRPLVAVLVLAALAGCSNIRTVQPVPADEVEVEISAKLEQETGNGPEVSCPGDLPAEVGAELVCTFTAGEPPADFQVTVTVTEVNDEDGSVVFSMVAEPAPVLPPS